MTRFWLALERLPGQAAVAAQWRRLLGDDEQLAARFTVVDSILATSYPRLDGPGGPFTVIELDPGDFVGVCEEDGSRVRLSEEDLVVYRLDPGRLVRAVAAAFDVIPDGTPLEAAPGTYVVGQYRPVAGLSFPVLLTIQSDGADYRHAIESIAARIAGPFLLLAPTNRYHRMASSALLESRNAGFIDLADGVAVEADGRLRLTAAGSQALEVFRDRILPCGQGDPGRAFFPTPAGATWKELQVRFLDGHTVRAEVGAVVGTFTYSQMGMSDRRNARPTRQWELLREFAQERGELTISKRGAKRFNQKRRENLAKDLKAFFRIDGEPIVLTQDRRSWRVVFALTGDC